MRTHRLRPREVVREDWIPGVVDVRPPGLKPWEGVGKDWILRGFCMRSLGLSCEFWG